MSAELVCVGLATQDTIVALPHWPQADGRLVVEALVRSGGGPAATAGVAAARLGRSVAFVGSVGTDGSASAVVSGLEAERVDVRHVTELAGRTPESVVLVDRAAATRTILHAPGVAPGELAPDAAAECREAAWVHVDHVGWPLTGGVERSRVSVDAGNAVPGLDLAGVGLYAPSEAALLALYPGIGLAAAVSRALAEGARRVAVTLGGRGALAAERDAAWRVPAAEVDVVSTLGAGDVFHGALLAALIEGCPLSGALRRANLAAALSCRALDARSAIPTAAELEAALAGSPEPEGFRLDAESSALESDA